MSLLPKIAGRQISQAELSLAFDAVSNRDNWKMPIDREVSVDDFTRELIGAAIIHFAGCRAVQTVVRGPVYPGDLTRVRFQAVGYYNAVGA